MERVVLPAIRRTVTGKKVGALRREGKLPAVLYGHKFDATPILLDLHQTMLKLIGLTSSSLVTIELDGKQHAALVREKQKNYITNTLLHVDFQVVSLKDKIRAKVMLELVGVSPAVKDFNGVVVSGVTEIEVESLPQDLPERIEVDISNLTTIGSNVHVRDIKLSDKVEILTDLDEMIVIITGAEEEKAVEETEGEGAEPEVIERGKKEEVEE
jgi:large subunit ribosomal protein L25